MTGLMDHAMNILGACSSTITKLPSLGVTVTKVTWEGCMTTRREEVDVGELIGYRKDRGYGGMIILYDKLGTRWEPLDHLRIVNGNAEIWT